MVKKEVPLKLKISRQKKRKTEVSKISPNKIKSKAKQKEVIKPSSIIKKAEAIKPSASAVKNKVKQIELLKPSVKPIIKSKKDIDKVAVEKTAKKIRDNEIEPVENININDFKPQQTATILNPDALTLEIPSLKKAPIGIKIISVLDGLISTLLIALAILIIGAIIVFGNLTIKSIIIEKVLAYILGLIFLSVGVLLVVIGVGLRSGRNWAKALQIIFYVLVLYFSIYGITNPYINLENNENLILYNITIALISLIIIAYLLFSTKVKEYFK